MVKFRKTLSIILVVVGLCCLLYPFISTFYNSFKHSYTLTSYETQAVGHDYSEEWKACREYNDTLVKNPARYRQTATSVETYEDRLMVVNQTMCFLEIPKIGVKQPVYHGTDEGTLSQGVGHMFGTSLPTGGENTHCVLSGHTGMASQAMFTELNELEIGDLFFITVLDEVHCYEVDHIEVVEPNDTSLLEIEEGDYCTLVTCVPLGINSHRLCVRGERKPDMDSKEAKEQTNKVNKVVTTMDKVEWFVIVFIILVVSSVAFSVYKSKQPNKDDLFVITKGDISFKNLRKHKRKGRTPRE